MSRTIDPVMLPRLALLVPVLVLLSTTAADPDLWGHVRFGGDILAARALPAHDAYAFTSDRPWVNHEWLAEAIFAAAFAAGGAAGLIALRLALLGAMLLLVARAIRRSGAPPIAHDLLVAFAAIGTYPSAHTVRPQLFSLLAFVWLLSCLSEYERRGWRALALVPMAMAFWANLHGGWLVGLGVLGVWGVGTMVTLLASVPAPRAPWNATDSARHSVRHSALLVHDAIPLAMLLLAAAGATAINPYGPGLWRFMAETVSFTRADITEWQPLLGASPAEIGLWVAACALGAWAAAVARPRPGALAVLALLALASLRVLRIEAFFVLSAVMIAGPALARVCAQRTSAGTVPAPVDRLAPPRALAVLAAAIVALVLADGTMRPSGRFGCIDASDPRLADRDAGAFLRKTAHVRSRMLTWFDWGEYAIWHFAPRVQVSIDGRRETVYSDAVLRAHFDFYLGRDNLALLDRLRPDLVWLRRDLPAVASLDSRGWRRVFDGPRSVVFQAPGAAASETSRTDAPSNGALPQNRACFPG